MAPKHRSALNDPPAASSSEEVEGSESESAESDSPEPTVSAKKAPSKPAISTQSSSSLGSEGSGSETEEGESDSDSPDSDVPTAKPIASKPMEEAVSPKSKQAASKAAPTPTPAVKSGSKRPSETTSEPKGSKRPKNNKKPSDSTADQVVQDEPKKPAPFQRIWRDDDEIAILEGMISFTADKGSVSDNMAEFYDYVKKSLRAGLTKVQVQEKVRRLKRKHKTCARKGDKYNPVKPHDAKVFELLKELYGDDDEGTSGGPTNGGLSEKPNGKAKKKVDVSDVAQMLEYGSEFGNGLAEIGFPAAIMRQGMEMIAAGKRAELNKEWRKLHIAQLKLFLKQTQLVLEAVQSSDR